MMQFYWDLTSFIAHKMDSCHCTSTRKCMSSPCCISFWDTGGWELTTDQVADNNVSTHPSCFVPKANKLPSWRAAAHLQLFKPPTLSESGMASITNACIWNMYVHLCMHFICNMALFRLYFFMYGACLLHPWERIFSKCRYQIPPSQRTEIQEQSTCKATYAPTIFIVVYGYIYLEGILCSIL